MGRTEEDDLLEHDVTIGLAALLAKLNRPCACEKPHTSANTPIECRRNPLDKWWLKWFIDAPEIAA